MEKYTLGAIALVAILLVSATAVPPAVGTENAREAGSVGDESVQENGQNATRVQNLTIDQLSLSNVTLSDTTIGTLELENVTRGNETISNRTMENLSADRVTVDGILYNVTLKNVTIRDDSVAEALLPPRPSENESVTNGTFDNITLEGIVLVEDTTLDGVVLETVVGSNITITNLAEDVEPTNATVETPVLEVESATIGSESRGNLTKPEGVLETTQPENETTTAA